MCDPATAAIVIGTAATGKYMADKQASKQEDAMAEQRRLAEQQAAEQRAQFEAEQAAFQQKFDADKAASEALRKQREEQFAAETAAFEADIAKREERALEIEKKRERELAELEAVPIMMRNDAQKTKTKGGSRLENMKVKKKAKAYTSVGGVGGNVGINV